MKIHLRADSTNEKHTRFTVFVNGANCGELCMDVDEAIHFHHVVLMTNYKGKGDQYISSGLWESEAYHKKWREERGDKG